ncbi:MAG TPA: hypothetical protein PKD64_16075 [Pirellulaceae bacterium]|nr:hypothetical protein [Pirellulaceae bacterium]HMO93706.1 hypothetical protein [Pirellulaceae bacterium]HMP70968.1 hypothetical protein [Pirellulaceae bacterium]
MIRKGLQITICLAILSQASISLAQQQREPNRNTHDRQTAPANTSGNYPPMVRPDEFNRQGSLNGNAPRQLSREQLSEMQAAALRRTEGVTLSDQSAQGAPVRQVSYVQDSVPVPSILGGSSSSQQTGNNSSNAGTPPQEASTALPTRPVQTTSNSRFPMATPEPIRVAQDNGEIPKPALDGQTMPPTQQLPAPLSQLRQTTGQDLPNENQFNPTRENEGTSNSSSSFRNLHVDNVSFGSRHQEQDAEARAALQSSEMSDQGSSSVRPMSLRAEDRLAGGYRTVEVQQTAAAQIRTEGPKLRVNANGPSSVGIGKPARYEITVTNDDRTRANDVMVGIDIPGWIEVIGMNSTLGKRELTDGSTQTRLIWSVPQIAAGTTEKLTLDVVPREARMFDLSVEWALMPISGSASVQVTEPKLEVEISGPNEVHFGEKTLYTVTISNPGTGTAENVNVILPEALGGERASLQQIAPGQRKQIQVELFARQPGSIELVTTASADGDLRKMDSRRVIVRRGELEIVLNGPPVKFAGSVASYEVIVSNKGDAIAQDIVAALALPQGMEYLSGVDGVERVQGGIRWKVGVLAPEAERKFMVNCQLTRAGEMTLEAAGRGKGDLATTTQFKTLVEAVADLKLMIEDPPGPLPTGQDVVYQIKIKNRGSKTARNIELVMQFSEGIEPTAASGHKHEVVTGQVIFSPIERIEPGQEVTLKVNAMAMQAGKHIHRAQLVCEEEGAREIVEGTTQFYAAGESTHQLRTGNSGSGSIR